MNTMVHYSNQTWAKTRSFLRAQKNTKNGIFTASATKMLINLQFRMAFFRGAVSIQCAHIFATKHLFRAFVHVDSIVYISPAAMSNSFFLSVPTERLLKRLITSKTLWKPFSYLSFQANHIIHWITAEMWENCRMQFGIYHSFLLLCSCYSEEFQRFLS